MTLDDEVVDGMVTAFNSDPPVVNMHESELGVNLPAGRCILSNRLCEVFIKPEPDLKCEEDLWNIRKRKATPPRAAKMAGHFAIMVQGIHATEDLSVEEEDPAQRKRIKQEERDLRLLELDTSDDDYVADSSEFDEDDWDSQSNSSGKRVVPTGRAFGDNTEDELLETSSEDSDSDISEHDGSGFDEESSDDSEFDKSNSQVYQERALGPQETAQERQIQGPKRLDHDRRRDALSVNTDWSLLPLRFFTSKQSHIESNKRPGRNTCKCGFCSRCVHTQTADILEYGPLEDSTFDESDLSELNLQWQGSPELQVSPADLQAEEDGRGYYDAYFHAVVDEAVKLDGLSKADFADGRKASMAQAIQQFLVMHSEPESRELLLAIAHHPAVRRREWDRVAGQPSGIEDPLISIPCQEESPPKGGGTYEIRASLNGKYWIYVGWSRDRVRRWKDHRSEIKKGLKEVLRRRKAKAKGAKYSTLYMHTVCAPKGTKIQARIASTLPGLEDSAAAVKWLFFGVVLETIDILMKDAICPVSKRSLYMLAHRRSINFLREIPRPLGKPLLYWLPTNRASPLRQGVPNHWPSKELQDLQRIFEDILLGKATQYISGPEIRIATARHNAAGNTRSLKSIMEKWHTSIGSYLGALRLHECRNIKSSHLQWAFKKFVTLQGCVTTTAIQGHYKLTRDLTEPEVDQIIVESNVMQSNADLHWTRGSYRSHMRLRRSWMLVARNWEMISGGNQVAATFKHLQLCPKDNLRVRITMRHVFSRSCIELTQGNPVGHSSTFPDQYGLRIPRHRLSPGFWRRVHEEVCDILQFSGPPIISEHLPTRTSLSMIWAKERSILLRSGIWERCCGELEPYSPNDNAWYRHYCIYLLDANLLSTARLLDERRIASPEHLTYPGDSGGRRTVETMDLVAAKRSTEIKDLTEPAPPGLHSGNLDTLVANCLLYEDVSGGPLLLSNVIASAGQLDHDGLQLSKTGRNSIDWVPCEHPVRPGVPYNDLEDLEDPEDPEGLEGLEGLVRSCRWNENDRPHRSLRRLSQTVNIKSTGRIYRDEAEWSQIELDAIDRIQCEHPDWGIQRLGEATFRCLSDDLTSKRPLRSFILKAQRTYRSPANPLFQHIIASGILARQQKAREAAAELAGQTVLSKAEKLDEKRLQTKNRRQEKVKQYNTKLDGERKGTEEAEREKSGEVERRNAGKALKEETDEGSPIPDSANDTHLTQHGRIATRKKGGSFHEPVAKSAGRECEIFAIQEEDSAKEVTATSTSLICESCGAADIHTSLAIDQRRLCNICVVQSKDKACSKCGDFGFVGEKTLAEHEKACGKEMVHNKACSLCGKTGFLTNSSFNRHERKCGVDKVMIKDKPCSRCGRAGFPGKFPLERHERACNGSPTQRHVSDRPCMKCGSRGFRSESGFEGHEVACHGNRLEKSTMVKDIACITCGKTGLRSKGRLESHEGRCGKVLVKDRPCIRCGRKGFRWSEDLLVHEMACDGNSSKPLIKVLDIACSTCGKTAFPSRRALQKHEGSCGKGLVKEKPCIHCGQTGFRGREALQRHEQKCQYF